MITSKYITYENLLATIKERSGIGYGCEYPSREGFPYGINEYEFNVMLNTIAKHNLVSGYEFATGVGISTLAIGMGFKATGGMLHSIDSYVEASTQRGVAEFKHQPYTPRCYDELNLNQKLMDTFGIHRNVTLHMGWSPQDAIPIVDSMPPIDFVFLDGPKTKKDYLETLRYLKPRLAEKYFIFVHDTHIHNDGFYKSFIIDTPKILRINPLRISKYDFGSVGGTKQYPLGVITNIKDADFLKDTYTC